MPESHRNPIASSALRLPDSTTRWLDRQVDSGAFASRAAAVEHLIRQARVAESRQGLEAAVRAGLRSGTPVPLTPKLMRDIERRGTARLTKVLAGSGSRRKKSA
jgi:Arc/MetJ-type ribon-helix-helix transcriptional regulator